MLSLDFGSAAFFLNTASGAPAPLFDQFFGTIQVLFTNSINITGLSKTILQYASPEILTGTKYRGPEAEVWALGCCLYIMLSGEIPFINPHQAVKAKYNSLKYPVSIECEQLLKRCFEVDPNKRASITELATSSWLRS